MAYRKLLVATDGSPSAGNAVQAAGMLASRLKSEVVVMYVVTRPGDDSVPPEFGDLERAEHVHITQYDLVMGKARDVVEQAERTLRALGVEEVHTKVEVGDAATELVDGAQRENVDLIVMGRRGLGRLGGLLLGSVTFKVTQVTKLPCLTVP